MKIIKADSRKDFKEQGLEISFCFLPSLIYRRYINKKRTIFFAWFWLTLTVRLSDYKEDYIILKYKWIYKEQR